MSDPILDKVQRMLAFVEQLTSQAQQYVDNNLRQEAIAKLQNISIWLKKLKEIIDKHLLDKKAVSVFDSDVSAITEYEKKIIKGNDVDKNFQQIVALESELVEIVKSHNMQS